MGEGKKVRFRDPSKLAAREVIIHRDLLTVSRAMARGRPSVAIRMGRRVGSER